jgi:hypothetical protein
MLGSYDGRVGRVSICFKCGWELRQDFGLWTDNLNGVVCDWIGGEPLPHEVKENLVAA